MLRAAIIILACILAAPAGAQMNCIPMTVVTPYATGAIQSIGYNSDTKNMIAAYRAAPSTIRAFQAVPVAIANRFTGLLVFLACVVVGT